MKIKGRLLKGSHFKTEEVSVRSSENGKQNLKKGQIKKEMGATKNQDFIPKFKLHWIRHINQIREEASSAVLNENETCSDILNDIDRNYSNKLNPIISTIN